jgi:CDP-glycerol glycerophosphotransferase
VTNGKAYTLGARPDGHAVLAVGRDVAPEEQGAVNQRRLREAGYVASRSKPLTDTVVYNSFGGRQYSDSPRAIHEELVRRGAPLEHLWIVSDAACRVPDTARAVRSGSREFYEALARSRYVVSNDHFPEWVRRRDDQTFVQTWHGTPLKKLGFDANEVSQRDRQFGPGWEDQVPNWQYVVSPNSFATPIMRRAYTIAGEILETGYPRNDVFFHPDRDALERRVRERLGLPDGARTVLYAPTFRDDLLDRRGRHRLDLHLDLAALRGALGPDTVLLFRKHHYIADAVPVTADGFVRDVSSYPEVNELLLATDVLVTDYSSLMFDYANTGRPMLFFTYDLEHYEERLRGFYLDFPEIAPGPLLRTSDEVAAALRDLDGVRARYADRYAAFARRFCEHDDGGAAARVVDRVFGAGG